MPTTYVHLIFPSGIKSFLKYIVCREVNVQINFDRGSPHHPPFLRKVVSGNRVSAHRQSRRTHYSVHAWNLKLTLRLCHTISSSPKPLIDSLKTDSV